MAKAEEKKMEESRIEMDKLAAKMKAEKESKKVDENISAVDDKIARIKAELQNMEKEAVEVSKDVKKSPTTGGPPMELECNIPVNGATIRTMNGRRCLFIPCQNEQNRNDGIDRGLQPPPPLVILGGMSQNIEGWQHHFGELSKERDVLMYEYLGSGRGIVYEQGENAETPVSPTLIIQCP